MLSTEVMSSVMLHLFWTVGVLILIGIILGLIYVISNGVKSWIEEWQK